MARTFTANYDGDRPIYQFLGSINKDENKSHSIAFLMNEAGTIKVSYELPDGTKNQTEIVVNGNFQITSEMTQKRGMIKIAPSIYNGSTIIRCMPVLISVK